MEKGTKARKKYGAFEVYVPDGYRDVMNEAERNAAKLDRSLSRYVLLAVAEYNKKVNKR